MTTARKRTATRPGVPLLRMLATRRTLCSARRKTSSLFCPVSNCTTLYANSEAVGKATGSQREANQRPTVGGGTESKRRTESGRCRRRHFAPDGAFTARCYLRSLLLAQREYIDQVQRKRGKSAPGSFIGTASKSKCSVGTGKPRARTRAAPDAPSRLPPHSRAQHGARRHSVTGGHDDDRA